jgi:hypothetical protein
MRTMMEWRYGLISDLDWDQRSASRPGRLTSQGKITRFPFSRRLGGSRSRSGRCRRKICCTCRELKEDSLDSIRTGRVPNTSVHPCLCTDPLYIVSTVRVGEKCNPHGAVLKRISWSCCIRGSIGASLPSSFLFMFFSSSYYSLTKSNAECSSCLAYTSLPVLCWK